MAAGASEAFADAWVECVFDVGTRVLPQVFQPAVQDGRDGDDDDKAHGLGPVPEPIGQRQSNKEKRCVAEPCKGIGDNRRGVAA